MLYSATKILVDMPKALSGVLTTIVARNWFGRFRAAEIPKTPFVEPLRLSLAEQWDRLATIICGAVVRAEDAGRSHASAALQIDLAQYALTSLVDELAAVMDVGDRRRRGNVHVLELQPTPPLQPQPFGDAIAA